MRGLQARRRPLVLHRLPHRDEGQLPLQGAVTCSAKLGPTTTEYFFRFRAARGGRPAAALVAVNATAAEKLERRLERLGVAYERRDLMKPVLLRLSRKVGAGGAVPRARRSPLRSVARVPPGPSR